MSDTFAHVYDGSHCFGLNEEAGVAANTFATELTNADGNVDGVSLNFVGGNGVCKSDPTKQYSLVVNLQCGTEAL